MMIDSNFYDFKGPFEIGEIANQTGLFLYNKEHENIKILGVGPLNEAKSGYLCFLQGKSETVSKLPNGAICLVEEKNAEFMPSNIIAIYSKFPRADFSTIARIIIHEKASAYSLKPQTIEENVIIGQNCLFGANVEIGENTIIEPNCVIGDGVKIGRNCKIGSGVNIKCAYIGDEVTIGANSVIGQAGFGVAQSANGLVEISHFGRVIIQDKVRIGALCTIDRGAFNDTVIGLESKLDNHCHIAHNVKLGRGVMIAAFGGISGSVEVGDFVQMGGRVGIGDHFKIGKFAKLAAGAAVLSDVGEGETFGGYPAKPRRQWLKEAVTLAKLSDNRNSSGKKND